MLREGMPLYFVIRHLMEEDISSHEDISWRKTSLKRGIWLPSGGDLTDGFSISQLGDSGNEINGLRDFFGNGDLCG